MSRHKPGRLAAMAAVIAAVLVVLFLALRSPDRSDPPDTAAAPAGGAGPGPTLPDDSQLPPNRTATPQVTAEPAVIWTPVDAATANAPPKVRDDLPATLLQLNRAAIESLAEGDTLTLPISPTASARMQISTVKLNSSFGVTSLRGSTLVNGAALPTVITYGANSTLATISTAEGVYELRGTADLGWLYRSADLGLPGGDVVDYVTPEDAAPRP